MTTKITSTGYFLISLLIIMPSCKGRDSDKKIPLPINSSNIKSIIKSVLPENPKEIFGQISQEPNKVWEILPPANGIVESILVKPDQIVAKETPLAVVRLTNSSEKTILKSPSQGLVLAVYTKENETTDKVTPLMTIAGTDLLKSSFDVYERDIHKIRIGQLIQAKTIAFPNESYEGEIVFISPQVDEETRSVKVQALIKNKSHHLRFGMLITGNINVKKNKSAETALEPEMGSSPTDLVFKTSKPIEISDSNGVIQTIPITKQTFKIHVNVFGEVTLESNNSSALKRCRFDLFESDLPRVSEGQMVRIQATALNNKEFIGQIIFISPRVDENTRGFKILAEVTDHEKELIPGMSLVGSIEVSSRSAFAVPLTAVQEIHGIPAVFASSDGKSFLIRKIELGERSDGMAEIVSGLKEGEFAVSHGGLLLKSEYLNLTEEQND